MGYQIIAISPDHYSNVEPTLKERGMKYLLLSDNTMAAAKSFGLAFRVSEETKERYIKIKIDLIGAAKADHGLLPVPAVFILNTEGLIQFEYVNPNHRVRCDADVLRAAAKAALK
ncbi:redoxin domain-containing protein [bacterium]|nr:redoxin domain-containing protein [bacterium]